MDDNKNKDYLGDGVYAEFDGYNIWLRANDHRDGFCTDKICIEPSVLDAMNRFYQRMTQQKDSVNEP